MYTLGYDVGSSSVKAALFDTQKGVAVAQSTFPRNEMPIIAVKAGWAEQDPAMWWDAAKNATREILYSSRINPSDIKAIGISYQMHGLVVVDKNKNVLRPSIIWCDSRAVEIGDRAFDAIGHQRCLQRMLNSPGNFTASKLRWVKENEPDLFAKIDKFMLPGDYLAMKLTGEVRTTMSGLSEGILWDFISNKVSDLVLSQYEIQENLVADMVPTFGDQGELTSSAASEFGLKAGTKLTYRAGDQPNNAFSLNVLEPGQVAATAGTSGVVYGISDVIRYDPQMRVNTFAHVNHSKDKNRFGILLCINGTGISYSWIRKLIGDSVSYSELNTLAAESPIGSKGLRFINFGNGAERMLINKDLGASFERLNFNIHRRAEVVRSVLEGVAFSFKYGIDIIEELEMKASEINAGHANMFLSPVFTKTLATLSGATINMYDTDGSVGAARAAAVGAGIYRSFEEAFTNLRKIMTVEPDEGKKEAYLSAYSDWLDLLKLKLKSKS